VHKTLGVSIFISMFVSLSVSVSMCESEGENESERERGKRENTILKKRLCVRLYENVSDCKYGMCMCTCTCVCVGGVCV